LTCCKLNCLLKEVRLIGFIICALYHCLPSDPLRLDLNSPENITESRCTAVHSTCLRKTFSSDGWSQWLITWPAGLRPNSQSRGRAKPVASTPVWSSHWSQLNLFDDQRDTMSVTLDRTSSPFLRFEKD
jgi:hypothetical protein